MVNPTHYTRGFALLALLLGLIVGIGEAIAEPASPAANAGWEEIGAGSASGKGISQTAHNTSKLSLAMGLDGMPIIAWDDYSSGSWQIYVRRWDGSAWVEMGAGSAFDGGISQSSGWAWDPSVAIGTDGKPIIAWVDDSNGDGSWQIYVRRWSGSAWNEIGIGSASGRGISQVSGWSDRPSMAISPDGSPIVAWQAQSDSNGKIYVRRWNGAAWVEMGAGSASGNGISQNEGKSLGPSLVIGTDDAPIVAWEDNSSGNYEIYIRRWNGSAWVEMGAGSASGGGISKNNGSSNFPSLAIGPDGAPVATWTDNSTVNREIYVRRWNGSAWVEMGAGSASGGGISNSSGGSGSTEPSLAIGLDGMPIVAWFNHYQSDYKIYVRRWNGSAWAEMDAGSASGGGISNTGGATTPSLATGLGATPVVAWKDGSSGYWEIYVRRYSPACYTLSRTHSGQGSNPSASPANSPGCRAGEYTTSQPIVLTATPAAGWRVAGWAGTNNDESTAGTNMLTMPEAEHTVSVTYQQNATAVYRTFAPSVMHRWQSCFSGPEEVEPNNNASQANGPLCAERSYTGLPNDRFDVFYFDTMSQGRIVLEMQNHVGGGVQLQLHYQAIGLNPIFDADGTDGYRVENQNAPAGRYYVVVSTTSPASSTTIRYALKASFNAE